MLSNALASLFAAPPARAENRAPAILAPALVDSVSAGPIHFTRADAHSPFFRDNVAGIAANIRLAIHRGCMPCVSAPASQGLNVPVWVLSFENLQHTHFRVGTGPGPRVIKYQLEALANLEAGWTSASQSKRLRRLEAKENTWEMAYAHQLWSHSWSDCAGFEALVSKRTGVGVSCRVVPMYLTLPPHRLSRRPLSRQAPPKYDALFFGLLSKGRKAMCTAISAASRSLRVRCVQSVFGASLRELIGQSRLVFSAEHYANDSLAVHRINAVLAEQVPVVTMPSGDRRLDALYAQWGVLFAPRNEMVGFIVRLLTRNSSELEAARQRTLDFARHVLAEREAGAPRNQLCAALGEMCDSDITTNNTVS